MLELGTVVSAVLTEKKLMEVCLTIKAVISLSTFWIFHGT